MICQCCNGALPEREIWEANRNRAGDCTGSVTAAGRCRAFENNDLWEIPAECAHEWHYYGTVNGRPDYGCQLCGTTRSE